MVAKTRKKIDQVNRGGDGFESMVELDPVLELKKAKDIISNVLPNDIKLIAKNDSQKSLIQSIKNNHITICAGHAGSGKTFVSLAYSLSLLRKTNNNYNKIYLVKSVTALRGEDVGFLPGDLDEKLTPAMFSYYVNIEKLIQKKTFESLMQNEIIKPLPLTYIRGASLDNCIIITDESQNISIDNIRTMMTRLGENSKIIILGDTNQIDLKFKEDSSLPVLIDLFKDCENIGSIVMDENDENVRNPIIKLIESKFKSYFEQQKENPYKKVVDGK